MFDPNQLQTAEQQGKHKQDSRPQLDLHHDPSKLLHIYCDNLPVTDHYQRSTHHHESHNVMWWSRYCSPVWTQMI